MHTEVDALSRCFLLVIHPMRNIDNFFSGKYYLKLLFSQLVKRNAGADR